MGRTYICILIVSLLLFQNRPLLGLDGIQLIEAASDGNIEKVRELIGQGVDVNVKNNGKTALQEACRNGHVEVVRFLLDAGADVHARTESGENAVSMAARGSPRYSFGSLIERFSVTSQDRMLGGTVSLAGSVASPSGKNQVIRKNEDDYIGTITLLRENGADIESKDDIGTTPLLVAMQNEKWEIAKSLLDWGADPNIYDQRGYYPLLVSVMKGNMEFVQSLLRTYVAIPVEVRKKQPLLGIAASRGDLEVIKVLSSAGIPFKIDPAHRRSPLTAAAVRGHLDCVKWFVSEYIEKIQAVDNHLRLTTIRAIQNGHLSIVRYFMDIGPDLTSSWNIGDELQPSGFLHCAVNSGDFDIFKLICDQSQNINVETDLQETPLLKAVEKNNVEMVAYLLAKGGDSHRPHKYGHTPLSLAAYHGHTEVAKLLISHDKTVYNENLKFSPLGFACQNNHIDTVSYLLDFASIDIDHKDFSSRTALIAAAGSGRTEIVKLLLNKGANVDSVDKFMITPLMSASLSGYLPVVNALLDSGATVDAKCHMGRTALMHASSRGHDKVVGRLIESGADLQVRDINGESAIDIAVEVKHARTVALIQDALEIQ
jgi:ankyrin repeat protein